MAQTFKHACLKNFPGILNFLSAEYFHLPVTLTLVLASPVIELTALKNKTYFFFPVPEVTDGDAGV